MHFCVQVAERSFDDAFVPRFETMNLLLHGHCNSFIRVFQKNCHETLLRNVVDCGSTYMTLQSNFCTGSVPDLIFLNSAGQASP